MSSLTLHSRYGVNPTIGVCFWCGQDDGTVGLLGYNRNKKASVRSVLTLEPCDKCKEIMKSGILFIEAVQEKREGFVQLNPQAYVSGRWVVLKKDASWLDLINPDSLREAIKKEGRAFVEPEVFEVLIPEEQTND